MRLSVLLAGMLFALPVAGRAQYDDYADDQGYDQAGEEAYAAPDQDAPSDQGAAPDFDTLGGYGRWDNDPQYGRVWVPSVATGWRPYVDGGWVWTSYGWTWVSSEPWAWTFHYGRWGYAPVWGWYWVPGAVWGPAWVDWYWGDGYVGWAPLAPFGPSVIVVDRYVFVPERHFCSPRLATFAVDHRLIPNRVLHGLGQRPLHRAPDLTRISSIAGDGVRQIAGRPDGTLAPGLRRRQGDQVLRQGNGSFARRAQRDDVRVFPRQPGFQVRQHRIQTPRGSWQGGGVHRWNGSDGGVRAWGESPAAVRPSEGRRPAIQIDGPPQVVRGGGGFRRGAGGGLAGAAGSAMGGFRLGRSSGDGHGRGGQRSSGGHPVR